MGLEKNVDGTRTCNPMSPTIDGAERRPAVVGIVAYYLAATGLDGRTGPLAHREWGR